MNMNTFNWCFTLNNWTEEEYRAIQAIDCKYLIIGKEVGKEEGTPHLQGYIKFEKRKRFKAVKGCFPNRTHLEPANGNSKQNIEYCSKDGDYFEKGHRPQTQGSGNKIRWDLAKQAAQEGRFDDIPAELYFKYYSTMKQIAKDNMQKPDALEEVCGLWIYGEAGTGKSHVVITQHPGRYIKPLNKWWDGYQGEDIVHIDEIEPSHTSWITPYLKKWADKWPFDAEIKGGALQIRPSKIVVTSNYSIDDMGFDVASIDAIRRRFKEIKKEKDQNIIV